MLDATRRTAFEPGSNLKGDVEGANWLVLLRHLPIDGALLIGVPTIATLAGVRQAARQVVIACLDGRDLLSAARMIRSTGASNVAAVGIAQIRLDAFADAAFDLVHLVDRRTRTRILRNGEFAGECRRVLAPGGHLYFEQCGLLRRESATARLGEACGGRLIVWTSPRNGEMKAGVPAIDARTIEFFLKQHIAGSSLRRTIAARLTQRRRTRTEPAGRGKATFTLETNRTTQLVRRCKNSVRRFSRTIVDVCENVERRAQRSTLVRRLTSRTAVLCGPAAKHLMDRPPALVESVARRCGVALDGYRWGFVAGADYRSRKSLLFLSCGGERQPEIVVKLTRTGAHSWRLQREAQALAHLEGLRLGGVIAPKLVFAGPIRDGMLVGESYLSGTPLERHTDFAADCPHVREVVAGVSKLGVRTRVEAASSSGAIVEWLTDLLGRYSDFYGTGTVERRVLERQIAVVANAGESLPRVYQHGDLGSWNLVVEESGRVAWLDWESAEREGMPLWDLFYFLRSCTVGAAKKQGGRDSLKAVAGAWLSDSSWGDLTASSVAAYCRQVQIDGDLVGPLFYLCWMHRALKESTRLTPATRDTGVYRRLLRLLVAERDNRSLRRLLGEQPCSTRRILQNN